MVCIQGILRLICVWRGNWRRFAACQGGGACRATSWSCLAPDLLGATLITHPQTILLRERQCFAAIIEAGGDVVHDWRRTFVGGSTVVASMRLVMLFLSFVFPRHEVEDARLTAFACSCIVGRRGSAQTMASERKVAEYVVSRN